MKPAGLATFQIIYALVWAAAMLWGSYEFKGEEDIANYIITLGAFGYVLSNGLITSVLMGGRRCDCRR